MKVGDRFWVPDYLTSPGPVEFEVTKVFPENPGWPKPTYFAFAVGDPDKLVHHFDSRGSCDVTVAHICKTRAEAQAIFDSGRLSDGDF